MSYDVCGIYKSNNDLSKTTAESSKSTTKNYPSSLFVIMDIEHNFFVNDSKSVAFVFKINSDKQEQFKLQNMNSSDFIYLNKQIMKELFLSIKIFLNINIEYPASINSSEKVNHIYATSSNTCKLETEKQNVNMMVRDLISILDFESFMSLLYINYLE